MGNDMSWILLIVAGLLEVVWAFAMKQSAGFSRLTPTLLMLVAMLGVLLLGGVAAVAFAPTIKEALVGDDDE